jgi:polysaccharide chain length determinant protein (PEP-CTERM system associated)
MTQEAGLPSEAYDDSVSRAQIRHFLEAPRRRPLMVLVPWVAVILLSVVSIFVLPKRYMSSTLILVESEKVPESFIPRVATEDRTARLEGVRTEIRSRTRLERVLEETNPYPGIESRTQAVEKLRSSVFINISGNDGFTIEFVHSDPHKAQEVTDRLARLFIEETIKSREEQVEGAVDFLVTQVQEAREQLEDKDAALRSYKEQRMGRLPEQLQTNLATMQMLQREMQTVEENLVFAREKQEALARGLGRTAPGTIGNAGPAASPEILDLTRQLAALRTRYKDEHPDVQSLRSRIARLEARLAGLPSSDAAESDPATAVAKGQLDRANLEVKKLEDRQRDLERRIAVIRRNVEETPRTEQELATLMRDYEKLNENYVALLSKQLEAQMSGRLERRWKGDRFRMLDPASLPEKPAFPKPMVFLALGVVMGLGVGIALSLFAEFIDPTVKDSEILQSIQGYPVLACISHHPGFGSAGAVRLLREDTPTLRGVEGHRRELGYKPWRAALPGEVTMRDEGVVARSKVVPFIESLRDHNSAVGEELRLLGANLIDLCRRRKASCIAFTSALPSEGKSTVSLGLASALAGEAGRRILLVEADLRRPALTPTLGLPAAHGLSEWLSGALDYVPVRRVEPGGFFLLAAGQAGLKQREPLGSPRMDAMLRAAREVFDFVILDAVPVLPVADTVLLQDLVDGFVLVVRSRQTPRDAVSDTLSKLRPDRVVGLVLNDHREYRGSYREHAYRRYRMTSDAAAPPVAATADVPGAARSALVGVSPDHSSHEPARPAPAARPEPASGPGTPDEAAAGLTFGRVDHARSRPWKPLVAVGLATLVLLGAAAGYTAVRGRFASAAPPVVTTRGDAGPVEPPAVQRVKLLEERLQAIEAEKAALEARAAETARKHAEAQAATREAAEPAVVARAQEEARRRVQAEQDRRLREEQQRLLDEQRAAEERLAEERRREQDEREAAVEVLAAPTTTVSPAVTAPPVPPVRPGTLVNLDDAGVIAPTLARAVTPAYPPIALRQRVEGTVLLNILVDERGDVVDAQVVAGVAGRSGLNEAAKKSVEDRKYRPAEKDGVPVKVWLPVRVQFRLP